MTQAVQRPPRQPAVKTVAAVRAANPTLIASTASWRRYVQTNWAHLKEQADKSSLASPYQKLVMMVFSPVMPSPAVKLTILRKLLRQFRYCAALSKRLTGIYKDRNYARTAEELAGKELLPEKLNRDEQIGLDWLIVATGGLDGSANQGETAIQFARNLLEAMRGQRNYPSAVRVQAGAISAGGHVIFAGQDVNIVAEHYHWQQGSVEGLPGGAADGMEHPDHNHSSSLAASYSSHAASAVHPGRYLERPALLSFGRH